MPKYRQSYTLFKRGKYYYYRSYTADGVRTVAHSTGCTSLSSARVYCDGLIRDGSLLSGSGKTFAEYAGNFFGKNSLYAKDNKLSEATRRNYDTAINLTLMPILANVKLSDINHTKLKQVRQKLLDGGMTAGTVNIKMNVLKVVMKAAFLDGLITKNPFLALKDIKYKKKIRDAFSIEDVKFIYSSVDDKLKDIILLYALTGLRLAELSAVSKDDIREKDGLHYIHLTRQFRKEFLPLKTKNERDIPIPNCLVPLIQEYHPNMNILLKRVYKVIRLIEGWSERKLCIHSFRHFFISSAKSYGINHLKVEAIAGHSLKGIQEVYTTFHVEDLAEIIKWQEWAYCQITGNEIK